MDILKEIKNLLDEVKAFKVNRIKDNQDKRNNKELINRRISQVAGFSSRLDNLKCLAIKDVQKIDIVSEIKNYNKAIELLLEEIRKILNERLENIETNMGESFCLKTAGSLLPVMNGEENTTKALIDSMMLYSEMLKPEHTKFLIKFVLKTRLSENAKIRLNKSYDSLEALAEDIRINFITQKSAAVLSNQLHQIRQLEKSIDDFGSEVEQLLSELTLAQAGSDDTLLKSLRSVNEQIAINSFCNGIRNHDVRMIVKARHCATLKEAINTAKDEEKSKPSTSNVFHFNNRGNFRGNGNYASRNRPNFRKPFNSNYRGFNNRSKVDYHQTYQTNRDQNSVRSRPYNNRGNYNTSRGRGNFRGRGNYPRNVYVAETPDNNVDSPAENNQTEPDRFFRN